MSSANIAAIILSAGSSARMGTFKPLLALGDRTILAHVVETMKSAGAGEILAVFGHRSEELAPVAENAGVSFAVNPEYERGMFSSVCSGIERLSANADAFFLLPVDICLVRAATLRRLISAWHRNPGRILHPVFAGSRGHPPLIPADLKASILDSNDNGGLRKVLERHEKRALEIPVADENVLFDLDRPEDYEEARRRFSGRADPSPAECDAILTDVHPVEEAAVRHSRLVQRAAAAVCRALNQSGAGLDEKRTAAAALLHDIAKGVPDHAAEGGRMLEALGFKRVGAIVAAHTDLPEEEVRHPKEAAVVYLADKLAAGDRFVSLESRFEAALERFGSDPAARAAVERRRDAATAVRQEVEKRTGLTLEEILLQGGIRIEYHSKQYDRKKAQGRAPYRP